MNLYAEKHVTLYFIKFDLWKSWTPRW